MKLETQIAGNMDLYHMLSAVEDGMECDAHCAQCARLAWVPAMCT